MRLVRRGEHVRAHHPAVCALLRLVRREVFDMTSRAVDRSGARASASPRRLRLAAVGAPRSVRYALASGRPLGSTCERITPPSAPRCGKCPAKCPVRACERSTAREHVTTVYLRQLATCCSPCVLNGRLPINSVAYPAGNTQRGLGHGNGQYACGAGGRCRQE